MDDLFRFARHIYIVERKMASKREDYIGHSDDDGEYYIGRSDDDDDGDVLDDDLFYKDINKSTDADDPEMLHDRLGVFSYCQNYPFALEMCLDRGSFNCALHIIQGNLHRGYPNLFFYVWIPKPKLPILFCVINLMCEPHVFHHLLYSYQGVTRVNDPFVGLLPLHWLLDLLVELPLFADWSPGQSLSTIIDSLFLPQIRPKLECARMLALHTRSLDQIVLGYIHNGEIISLVALLLVAPFTKGDFETFKSYTSSIAFQEIHDESVTPSKYCAAAALLCIFEKHGDELTSMFNNEHNPAGAIAQILSTDVDLTDAYSNSSHPEMLESTFERLGIKKDDATQIKTISTRSVKV